MTSGYVCGKCGKTGHNRRTCGKSPSSPAPAGKISPTRTVSEKGTSTVGDAYSHLDNSSEENRQGALDPVVETMTVQDIETWWLLTSGKTGKREKRENETYRRWWGRDQIVVSWDYADTKQLLDMLNVAVEQRTSPKALRKFLNFFGAAARTAIAGHPDLDDRVLPVLVKDTSSKVRQKTAQRKNLPEPIMNVLAVDKSRDVRMSLARNADVSASAVSLMFHHRDDRMVSRRQNAVKYREKILCHPQLPAEDRQEALYSNSLRTASLVFKNPNIAADEIAHKWHMVETGECPAAGSLITAIISHPKTPVEVLDKYVDRAIEIGFVYPYSFYMFFKPVFQNAKVHTGTITKIFNCKRNLPRTEDIFDEYSWEGIASHPNATVEQLEWITRNCHDNAIQLARTNLQTRNGAQAEPVSP